jgi:Phage ABA sandwich domain
VVYERIEETGVAEMNLREIDRLVAEKVMGCTKELIVWLEIYDALPHYSTNIADAWKVVNEMNKKGFYFNLDQDSDFEFDALFADGYYAEDTTISVISSHKSAPLAICLAALKTVGAEVSE